jgi:glycosyltransferase involved in cell wall biosynthesis
VTVRVLWVIKGIGPGGAERLLAATAASDAVRRADLEITCAYVVPWKDHLADELERLGVRCVCLSARRRDPRWPMRLRRLVLDGDFDVVHGHSPLPMSVARVAARVLPGGGRRPRLMSTEHNSAPTYRAPTRLLNRWTLRADEQVWAVSDEVRRSVRGARTVQTLQHGIDVGGLRRQQFDRQTIRRSLNIADDDIVVGTVANFREQKDYPNLLKAAAALVQRGVRFRLLIVGQGPLEASTRAQATELGLDEVAVFTGYRADATAVMSTFDVFALASRWEGLPVALMEALALGLPVVATNVGGVGEALRTPEDALLVPPSDHLALADALQPVIEDSTLRRTLSVAAAALADRYDIEAAASTMVAAYGAAARPTANGVHLPTLVVAKPLAAGLELRVATEADEPQILQLLGRSLGWDDPDRFAEFFHWKHALNAFGPSPMWLVEDTNADGRIVAFRAFMRWSFVRGGRPVPAVRAVDTATDPDYQGRGLFTAMTMHGVAALADEGVAFVFNTPNDQSRPGYLKMGWRDVGRLRAAVHVCHMMSPGRLRAARVPADHWSQPIDVGLPVDDYCADVRSLPARPQPADVRSLRTASTIDSLRWRYGLPSLGYRVVDDGAGCVVVVRLRLRGQNRELVHAATLTGGPAAADRTTARVAGEVGADHVLRLGDGRPYAQFVRVPNVGPRLTWRPLNDLGMPPLSNWNLELGDVELF